MEEIRQRNDNIVQNAWFLARESWRWDKRILLFLGITVLTGILLPLFGIYLPKVAVDLLVQKAEPMRVLEVLGSMVGCLLVLQGLHGYLSKRAYFHHNECRNTYFVQRLFLVSLQCKYSNTEDGDFYKLYRRAINSVRSGDASGTSVFFDQIPQAVTGIACFFLYSGILARLHVLVIVFLLLTSLVTYFFRRRENLCYERTRDDYAMAEKRLYYTIGACGNSRTGMDIRVYNMKNWLTGQIQRFQGEEREILKIRRRKEYQTHLMSCGLNFLRDGFAYVYLIVETVQGRIGMGDFMLFFGAITGFSAWVTGLVDQMSAIKTANVKMNDLRTFLDVPPEDAESGECELPDLSDGVEIEFEHKDAPVLLLDEPTAALDPLAEQEVYETYQRLCENRTALFISHRLASTQFSDWIMFLQNGRIIERGSHKELLRAGGEYARLYELQSHYYSQSEEDRERGEADYECE